MFDENCFDPSGNDFCESCGASKLDYKSISLNNNAERSVIELVNERYKYLFNGAEPDQTFIQKALFYTTNIDKAVEMFFNYSIMTMNSTVMYINSAFEKIYSRPITIHEFLKYFNRFQYESETTISRALMDSKKRFDIAFNVVKQIHSNYVDQSLKEFDFIKNFIHTIDNDNYSEIIIDSIINNTYKPNEYWKCLSELISNLYHDTYKKSISTQDLEYIFLNVAKQKLHLKNGEVKELICEKYEQTTKFLANISDIFNEILQREPDEFEKELYIVWYRDDYDQEHPTSITQQKLQNELYNSLEYNEVIKIKIITLYKEIHNQTILPSTTYKILNKVINDDNLKRNMNELSNYIRDIIDNRNS